MKLPSTLTNLLAALLLFTTWACNPDHLESPKAPPVLQADGNQPWTQPSDCAPENTGEYCGCKTTGPTGQTSWNPALQIPEGNCNSEFLGDIFTIEKTYYPDYENDEDCDPQNNGDYCGCAITENGQKTFHSPQSLPENQCTVMAQGFEKSVEAHYSPSLTAPQDCAPNNIGTYCGCLIEEDGVPNSAIYGDFSLFPKAFCDNPNPGFTTTAYFHGVYEQPCSGCTPDGAGIYCGCLETHPNNNTDWKWSSELSHANCVSEADGSVQRQRHFRVNQTNDPFIPHLPIAQNQDADCLVSNPGDYCGCLVYYHQTKKYNWFPKSHTSKFACDLYNTLSFIEISNNQSPDFTSWYTRDLPNP